MTRSETKRRWSRSEKAKEVEAWRNSGLTARDYARTRGFGYRSLYSWSHQLGTGSKTSVPKVTPQSIIKSDQQLAFVKVELRDDDQELATESPSWELSTPSGHCLKVKGQLNDTLLSTLLQELLGKGARR